MKTEALIKKIVNRYIGVEDGYIGMPTTIRFSYRNHSDFYPEFCDLYKILLTMKERLGRDLSQFLQTPHQQNKLRLLRVSPRDFPYLKVLNRELKS